MNHGGRRANGVRPDLPVRGHLAPGIARTASRKRRYRRLRLTLTHEHAAMARELLDLLWAHTAPTAPTPAPLSRTLLLALRTRTGVAPRPPSTEPPTRRHPAPPSHPDDTQHNSNRLCTRGTQCYLDPPHVRRQHWSASPSIVAQFTIKHYDATIPPPCLPPEPAVPPHDHDDDQTDDDPSQDVDVTDETIEMLFDVPPPYCLEPVQQLSIVNALVRHVDLLPANLSDPESAQIFLDDFTALMDDEIFAQRAPADFARIDQYILALAMLLRTSHFGTDECPT